MKGLLFCVYFFRFLSDIPNMKFRSTLKTETSELPVDHDTSNSRLVIWTDSTMIFLTMHSLFGRLPTTYCYPRPLLLVIQTAPYLQENRTQASNISWVSKTPSPPNKRWHSQASYFSFSLRRRRFPCRKMALFSRFGWEHLACSQISRFWLYFRASLAFPVYDFQKF